MATSLPGSPVGYRSFKNICCTMFTSTRKSREVSSNQPTSIAALPWKPNEQTSVAKYRGDLCKPTMRRRVKFEANSKSVRTRQVNVLKLWFLSTFFFQFFSFASFLQPLIKLFLEANDVTLIAIYRQDEDEKTKTHYYTIIIKYSKRLST